MTFRTSRLYHNMKKPTFWIGAEAVGWAACREAACQRITRRFPKISSGNLYPFETKRPKRMKTFDFPQETISHTIRNPHSKALEPDCLCPWTGDYDTVSSRRKHDLVSEALG